MNRILFTIVVATLCVGTVVSQSNNLAVGRLSFNQAVPDATKRSDLLDATLGRLNIVFKAGNLNGTIFNLDSSSEVVYQALFATAAEAESMQGDVTNLGAGIHSLQSVLTNAIEGSFATTIGNSGSVTFSNQCGFSSDAFPPIPTPAPVSSTSECKQNTVFTLYTEVALSVAMDTICSIIFPNMPCNSDNIRIGIQTGSSTSDSLWNELIFTVFGVSPEYALDKLTTELAANSDKVSDVGPKGLAAQSASGTMNLVWIKTVSASDKLSTSTKTDPPECEDNMWYLIFLILILPAIFMAVKHAYHRGKKKGANNCKDKHEEEMKYQAKHGHHGRGKEQPQWNQNQQHNHGNEYNHSQAAHPPANRGKQPVGGNGGGNISSNVSQQGDYNNSQNSRQGNAGNNYNQGGGGGQQYDSNQFYDTTQYQ